MAETSWIGLSARERALLLDALAALRRSNLDDPSNIDALTIKLVHSAPHPDITSAFTADRSSGRWETRSRSARAITMEQATRTLPTSINMDSGAGCGGSRVMTL